MKSIKIVETADVTYLFCEIQIRPSHYISAKKSPFKRSKIQKANPLIFQITFLLLTTKFPPVRSVAIRINR